MHRLRSVKDVGLLLFLYCNSSFCFRASDSLTPALDLCYCASFTLFLFFSFFNQSFSVVSARSWRHCSACNHNSSLIMFIDFNIEINKNH